MLSPQQLDQYHQRGYLHLPAMVEPTLLDRLEKAIAIGIQQDTACIQTHWFELGQARIACFFDKLLESRQPQAFLGALGLPMVTALMEDVMGDGWFPSDGHAVLKQMGVPDQVSWHRDLLHSRQGPSCMMGIYLDNSEENDGALMVVEGSHLMPEDICQVKKMPCRHVPAQRGDIIVHDQMLAHSSSPLRRIIRRRVVYFTFHHPAQVMHDGHFNPELMTLRQALPALARAVHAHQAVHPSDPIDGLLPAPLQSELERIRSRRFQPPPSSYCFEEPHILTKLGPVS
jgi:Phytanoyl-CoA dioxygenase (PhyH)